MTPTSGAAAGRIPTGSPAPRAGLPARSRTGAGPDGRRARFAAAAALLVMVEALVFAWLSLDVDERPAGHPARASPSGLAAPVGDLPGWRQIFVDEFDGTTVGPSWGVYEGVPSGDPGSRWEPSQVIVENSTLVLRAEERNGRWITGGVSNHPVGQTYGKWEVRFRADASDEIPVAFLLWPRGGSWPPEIDFFEDVGGDRSRASAFLHYRTDGATGRDKDHRGLAGDFTDWHTVGVEWTPGRVRLLLDGAEWAGFTGGTVPSQPMWLALQAQSGGCARRASFDAPPCPVVGSPPVADIEIDWVAVWEPAG